MSRDALPIDDVLPDLLAALRSCSSVVLQAPTGAGKTTRVPPALLDGGLAGSGRVVLVEPRRLAARAAAARMAQERGQSVGQDIGYSVRFDKSLGPRTRIVAVTEGVLLRQLLDDPFLESTSIVLFDEFHERSLNSDLALGMVRLVQQTVRPDLRLVVMSATLAGESIANYLGECPIVRSEGRLFPVEIRYEPKSHQQSWPEAVAQAVERLAAATSGDVLAFLPGWSEIRHTARLLSPFAAAHDVLVAPLHGDLPADQQDAALLRGPRRRIVLATNVAETSITVEGVTGVVDSGLVRQMTLDPHLGLDRLELTPISQAAADQRAGRAGRLQSGVCIRLWSPANHRQRPAHTEPEIRRVDLAGAALHLLCLGDAELAAFPWLEAPRPESVVQALELLRRLGCISERTVTETGRQIASLPVHPRLGRLLIDGWRRGDPENAALAAALLSERDPFTLPLGGGPPPDPRTTSCDLLERLEALNLMEGENRCVAGLQLGAAKMIFRVRNQYLRELRGQLKNSQLSQDSEPENGDALPRALLAAFPDRVVRRRPADPCRGVVVGGRGVRLANPRGLTEGELFLAIDIEDRPHEALVRRAVSIQRDWLERTLLTSVLETTFDGAAERVVARRRLRYLDLVLEEAHAAPTNPDEVARLLAEAAAPQLSRVLPTDDSPAGRFLTRVRWLRSVMPDLDLPTYDDDQLRSMLPYLAVGRRSFAELRDGPWLEHFFGMMSHAQRQLVEREAPERLEVPSGSRILVQYESGKTPVLAVRIQELFGLAETPRLAGGRVPVLLHLLAPSQRPQQMTDDLASFWSNVYPRIRKELRAQYPKHAWPEDPLTASPQSRPVRRSS